MVTPKFRAEDENCMSVLPTEIDVGAEVGNFLRFCFIKSTSVFSSFSLSLFDVIHCLMSVIQLCMLWMVFWRSSGKQES